MPVPKRARQRLLLQVEQLLEGPMIFLGLVWLVLLVVELTQGLSPFWEGASLLIWAIFILDFLLKLLLAPAKGAYLRRNWLTGLSLLVPALRVVRFFRVLRIVRGIRLVRLVTSVNRSLRSLGATMRRRGFGYVVAATCAVILGGGAGMYTFEREGGLDSYGEALYWTAMLITSIGSEYWPVTPEGKALTLLLSVYGFCVFGYITATLASFFVGRDAEEEKAPLAGAADLKALREEIASLRKLIESGAGSRGNP